MKRKLIFSLMGVLCLSGLAAQMVNLRSDEPDSTIYKVPEKNADLQHHVMIDGGKYWVDRLERRVKKIDDTYYALVEGEFYKLEFQPQTNNIYSYEFFVTLKDGSRFYITRESYSKLYRSMGLAEATRNAKTGKFLPSTGPIYPDSKPFEAIEYEVVSQNKNKAYSVKVTPKGRLISDEEFQTYKGNFKYIKKIDGGPYAMDTTVIRPPSTAEMKAVEAQEKAFEEQVGKYLQAFRKIDIHGDSLISDQLKGKVVVVNFWFVGCPPCIKEMPGLNQLVSDYQGKDVVFLAFATDPEPRITRFLERKDFDYLIIPESLDIAEKYLVTSYPTHFIIDKQGTVRFAHKGFQDDTLDKMREFIDENLSQKP